ncbi:MAG: hypothetical protein IJ272_03970 [Clostridia bacterium]|nr:hypothetical protein [Clostridia bacterium]
MTNKELNNLKKALNKDVDDAQIFIGLARLGVAVGATTAPEQSANVRETIISNLTSLKQRISTDVEKLMAEIDDAINQMSC